MQNPLKDFLDENPDLSKSDLTLSDLALHDKTCIETDLSVEEVSKIVKEFRQDWEGFIE